MGVDAFAVKCDVTNNNDIVEMIKACEAKFGKIDILVNNAGVGDLAPATEMPVEVWNKVINTNLNSLFFVAREVAKKELLFVFYYD